MKKGIVSIVSAVMGVAVGVAAEGYRASVRVYEQKSASDKHLALYLLMNQWVRVKQEKKSIAGYLEEKGYKEIAIYGMNYVGQTLLKEFEGSDVEVKYGIDKKAEELYSEVKIVSPEEELEQVDAIIVTPITFYSDIEEMLSVKTDIPVLSFEDILYAI